jgi:hypothetical protein
MADFVITGTIGAFWGAFVILTLIRILAKCVYPPIKLMEILWPPKKQGPRVRGVRGSR